MIIQNKKTTEAFAKFHPLFMEALNNNRIGVCKWIESGTTIDTAVPEIRELTNDKKEWKAIIVRFVDEGPMSDFEADEINPYDFLVNQGKDDEVEESDVPLIRLTHLLGGIPAPTMKFECEQVFEEGKAPRTIYKPVDNKEQEEAYKKLCKKYEFNGVAPSSISIVTIREGCDAQDKIDVAWKTRRESTSSEFWKRNKYPSICRFLVYDFAKKGPIQRNADEFGFWLSVLLLSSNDIDPGSLQAYRLYNIKTKYDKNRMEECFQNTVDRLKIARYTIEKEIRREIEGQLSVEVRLPDYRLEVPVTVKLPKKDERTVDTGKFGIFSKGANTDIGTWEAEKAEAEEWLDNSVRVAERTLDQTGNRIRECCTFSEDEVSPLDRYQEEDMVRETGEIYREIVKLQGGLPMGEVTQTPIIIQAAQKVDEHLRGRVNGKHALSAIFIILALVTMGQIPAMINLGLNKVGSIWQILLVLLVEWLVVSLFAMFALLIQKWIVNDLIERYNRLMRQAFNKLTEDAGDYTKYLSNIASHSRGHSYMNWSKRKKNQKVKASHSKYQHIKAINVFLVKMKDWVTAYHLNVDFDVDNTHQRSTVDTSVPPSHNPLYTFEMGGAYPININNSGQTVDSPFNFVEKIEITREELYDDDEAI